MGRSTPSTQTALHNFELNDIELETKCAQLEEWKATLITQLD